MFFKGPGDINHERRHTSIVPKRLKEYLIFRNVINEKMTTMNYTHSSFSNELIQKYFPERINDDVTIHELINKAKREESGVRAKLELEEYEKPHWDKWREYNDIRSEWKKSNLSYFERFFIQDNGGHVADIEDYFEEYEFESTEDYSERTLKKLAKFKYDKWTREEPLCNYPLRIGQFKHSRYENYSGEIRKFEKKYVKIVVNELEILADTKNEPFYVLGVNVKSWRKN